MIALFKTKSFQRIFFMCQIIKGNRGFLQRPPLLSLVWAENPPRRRTITDPHFRFYGDSRVRRAWLGDIQVG
jgi:hypothetical protein